MTEEKLIELSRKSVKILGTLAKDLDMPNVSNDQEITILAQLGPVILQELIAAEKSKS